MKNKFKLSLNSPPVSQPFWDDREKCTECGCEMDGTDHNYGRDDALCCIHCWNLAQAEFEDEQRQEKVEAKIIYLEEYNKAHETTPGDNK